LGQRAVQVDGSRGVHHNAGAQAQAAASMAENRRNSPSPVRQERRYPPHARAGTQPALSGSCDRSRKRPSRNRSGCENLCARQAGPWSRPALDGTPRRACLDAMLRPQDLRTVGQLDRAERAWPAWLVWKLRWPGGCQSWVSTTVSKRSIS
jgi:hypothetical protein